MEPSNAQTQRTLAVGIGASAGGLEACCEFFEAMPAAPEVAFIVVMHLDRRRISHVAEILQRSTSLTVTQVTGTCRLETGHVYVIAPNTELSINGDSLHVDTLGDSPPPPGVIDALFSSLCESHKTRCVGILLSGSGRDGASGLHNIRAGGGLCIAQDPHSAQFPSMPQAAIDGGAAHASLAPAQMPAVLLEFEKTGALPEDVQAENDVDDAGGAEHAAGFEAVLDLLGKRFDIDFGDYKEGTLRRRAQRRMALKEIRGWGDYFARLSEDPDELFALYSDVLIGVTSFFRDPEVWERLARQIPALLARRTEKAVRAWVPGCATGEEAYSLAMLLFEQLADDARSPRIKIYATDLSNAALTVARRGLYSLDIAQDVSEERLKRFFHRHDDQFLIDPRIRECVTFAPHNALSDASFSHMDIVSCRNLLIYLDSAAHERLLQRFHFSLGAGGLLVLGRSETIGRQSALFEEIAKRQSLYRARSVTPRHDYQVGYRASARMPGLDLLHAPAAAYRPSGAGMKEQVEQFVLNRHTPARVVIDQQLQILYSYGDTHPYLLPPTGESSRDLLSWIRSGFYVPFRTALNHAFEEHKSRTAEGQVDRDGEISRVQCVIEPMPTTKGGEALFLLTFNDVPTARQEALTMDDIHAEEPLARQLEVELLGTRRELQSAMEQLEAAGEEYRASHEELLSVNEELQSSNEELEASKEELESLNEEMNTINKELEEKNAELRGANADLNNLFASSGIPTIFLDNDLNVRRYTAAATEAMYLVPADVGRSIEHIKQRVQDKRLAADAKKASRRDATLEAEAQTEEGRSFLRRIVPYRLEDRIEGVCVTYSEITEQKQAMQESEAARSYAEAIVRTVRTPLLVLDEGLNIVSSNPAFDDSFHVSAGELEGTNIGAIKDERWNTLTLQPLLKDVLAAGSQVKDFEIASANHSMLVNAYAMQRPDEPIQILLSIEDITAQKALQGATEARSAELVAEAQHKDEWIAMLGHELRNPIGAISTGLKLLEYGTDAAREAGVRNMMRRQVNQVGHLLDDLLDAARIIAGKLEISREPVDLAAIGEAALEATASLMEERRHHVVVCLPASGEVLVMGDFVRLTEVFVNLLTNAAKYTENGGTIDLTIEATGDTATISVGDTGIGIDADAVSSMFEMFTQGTRTLGRPEKGLGLGLPLVRSIVERHGGEVDAFSEGAGKGSRFEVRLPRTAEASRGGSAQRHPEGGPRPARPRRVLIVDDEADGAAMLEQVLEMQGHATRIVHDGVAALEVAATYEPEAVLLDIGLPEMDGYEVARRLRARGETMLLIAMTGYKNDELQLQEAGFDRHLIKPIDFGQLSDWLAGLKSG